MALLEIIHLTGDVERRDLYKRQPMTIGSHASNDLRIEEKGVDILHCRISWNKDNWEAVSAGMSPFDLNGVPVQKAVLKTGDTLRFGTVDVRFHAGLTVEDSPSESIGIKPTTEEEIQTARDFEKQKKAAEPTRKPAPPVPDKTKGPRSDEDLMQSLELLAMDSKKSAGSGKKKAANEEMFEVAEEVPGPASSKSTNRVREKPVEESLEEFEPDELSEEPKSASGKEGLTTRLKDVISSTPKRPGEQEPLKSPLVLGLTAGCVLLVLAGFVFYFIAFRRIAESEFEMAKGLLNEGKYQQGEEALREFLMAFPKHPKAPEADLLVGISKIDQKIGGKFVSYAEGIQAIRDFVNLHSDHPLFESMKPEIASRAGNAALAAAQLAGKKAPEVGEGLLSTAVDATTLFTNYSPKDAQPTEKVNQIKEAMRVSKLLIDKSKFNAEGTASITQAISNKKPMEALRLRRDLLARYPDFASNSVFRDLLKSTMEVEQTLVQAASPNTPAVTEEWPVTLPVPRTLMFHARTGTDDVSVNEVVWVLGKDCLYGVDTMTGLPVWRRVVGTDPAFFPQEEDTLPSLIYYDSDHDEIVRVKRNTGELVWRQALGERATGQPLIEEGKVYVSTVGGVLLKLDLEAGTILSSLTFSQPISGPTVIRHAAPPGQDATGDSHLVVDGDQDVIYTVTKSPLECSAVSYFAQKSQSVVAPLISVAEYVAYVENHSEESSTLHLIKLDGDKMNLVEAGTGSITGMVVDQSVIRGSDLFVPSTVERVSAFSVSNTVGEPPLTAGPTYQVQGAIGSSIYLTTGPEKQVWMSSSALRRLQLAANAIQVDPKVEAIGLSSQPNQHQGALLFNARRRPFTDAVTLTQTDRDTLTSTWQLVAGSRLIAVSVFSGDNPSLLAVSEGGAPFRMTAAELAQSGFQAQKPDLLPINRETSQPILACALPDAQVAVVSGDPEPRIWILNRLGQIERQGTLPASPQAAPVRLGKRVLVPVAGRLHVARTGQGDSAIQDYQFPSGEAPPTWTQVLAVDDKNVVGVTDAGELLQIRQEAKNSLALVARQALPGPVVGKMVISQGRFATACATGDVLLFDATKLEPRGQRKLETSASGAAYVTSAGVVVESGHENLHCLNPDAELTDKWTIKLPDSTLAGQPVEIAGDLVLVFRSGLVLHVNPDNGEIVSEQQAAGRLDSGPLQLGNVWFVTTWDGSLIPLTPPPKS